MGGTRAWKHRRSHPQYQLLYWMEALETPGVGGGTGVDARSGQGPLPCPRARASYAVVTRPVVGSPDARTMLRVLAWASAGRPGSSPPPPPSPAPCAHRPVVAQCYGLPHPCSSDSTPGHCDRAPHDPTCPPPPAPISFCKRGRRLGGWWRCCWSAKE